HVGSHPAGANATANCEEPRKVGRSPLPLVPSAAKAVQGKPPPGDDTPEQPSTGEIPTDPASTPSEGANT
ncbi:hypothetical protein QNA28_22110, partial [Rhodococcus rhodochrous]|nr:hypothetical protein [Rhodococcus rhodochrous]